MKNLTSNQSNYLQPHEAHEYLQPQEVGPIIKRKTSTVWSLLRSGILPHIKLNGKYLIRRESLLQWLATQEKGGI
jgi:hypothetical protein